MTEVDFKTNTVFYCYPPNMNQPVIPLLVRGAHLAQGIPALTPVAGRMRTIRVVKNAFSDFPQNS